LFIDVGGEKLSLNDAADFAAKLGIFKLLKDKLIKRPDVAAEQLAGILEELGKTFEAMDTEVVNYLSLWFDENNPGQVAQERKKLYELEGGKISARVGKVRVHCHKIAEINKDYLDKWFVKAFSPSEHKAISETFSLLGTGDSYFNCVIDSLAKWLAERAQNIQNILDQRQYERANEELQKERKEALPQRNALSQAMRDFYELQEIFLEVAKKV
jgi:hypothetical protein